VTTLRDVADIVGVHPSTVSRALDPASANLVSEKTRARVQAVADELGFQPDAVASGLRRGRSQTLGVVVPDLGNPYAAPMIRGIENSLESRGYLAFITETQDEHARARRIFEHLLSRRVDAIICLSARAGDASILRRAARKVPVVLAVRDLPESGLPGVVGDDERGGRLAADHLLAQGHRAVSQLRGPESIHTFVLRGTGFSSRIREEGLAPIEIEAFAQAPTVDEGHAVMTRLLATHGPRPTAVFAHNDLIALGAIAAIREAGLDCPRDISVIGYNDAPLTRFTDPPLTTIALPQYEIGRFAAEVALSLIEHPDRQSHVLTLPPRLVVRESVRRLTAAD
jgi:LacI family transcriptional regulator